MFSTIVVGTDGSKDAEQALRVVADMAAASPAKEIHVVTAYKPISESEMRKIVAQLPEEFHTVLTAHTGAESILDDARAVFGRSAAEVEYHEVNDDPTDAILDTAERSNADLIVVGSRGDGLAKRAVHGSVSTKVLHHAPCSVLVVKVA